LSLVSVAVALHETRSQHHFSAFSFADFLPSETQYPCGFDSMIKESYRKEIWTIFEKSQQMGVFDV
jgi:hypothetical protein